MSLTMLRFKEVTEEILSLEKKKMLLCSNFEKSTGELAECFHWILAEELEGKKHICLTVNTCPELYAKELENMGFVVKERRNAFDTLCGYEIEWQ